MFLDLKAVSNTVIHEVLLSMFTLLHFSVEAIKWMTSYLSNRRQSVCLGNSQSMYLNCNI